VKQKHPEHDAQDRLMDGLLDVITTMMESSTYVVAGIAPSGHVAMHTTPIAQKAAAHVAGESLTRLVLPDRMVPIQLNLGKGAK